MNIKFLLLFSLIVFTPIVSCNSATTINETSRKTTKFDETIHIQNCGNKAESVQTSVRSFSSKHEGGASLKLGYQVVEGSVVANYGEYKDISKSQTLTAAPNTNMKFVLRWSEDVRAGNVKIDGQTAHYTVTIPISVEQISSQDLGCPSISPIVPPSISLSKLLPDADDINKNWEETETENSTNEDLAKRYDDPSSMFLLFKSWGRVTGLIRTYEHSSKCNYKSGVQYMTFGVTIYETKDGVNKAIDWFADEDNEESASQNKRYDVGDEMYVIWYNNKNSCDEPDNLRQVKVRFRKHNVNASVFVSSVKYSLNDDELLETAIWFAKRIELKILSNSTY